MTTECVREDDVLDMVAAARWPGRCDAELAAHIHACGVCRDLVTVAVPLLDEHDHATCEAQIPPPALVWWRAQARAREEAARAAARPIAFAQGAAAACAVWAAVSLIRAFPASRGLDGLDWLEWTNRIAGVVPDVRGAASAIPGGVLFLVVIGGSVLLAPIALLVILREVLREE